MARNSQPFDVVVWIAAIASLLVGRAATHLVHRTVFLLNKNNALEQIHVFALVVAVAIPFF